MKNPKVLLLCLCCALGGVVLGVGLGRVSGPGGAKRGTNGETATTALRVVADAGSDRSAASGEFPDLTGLKTPEQWREYIEMWMAAGCPGGRQKNVFECLRRWSEVDADGTLAFVGGAAKFPMRNEAYAIPLAVIGAKDMGRVIGWLQKNPHKNDSGSIAGMVIMKLKDTHPTEAWALARADNIPVRPYYFGEIMQAMLKTNPADSLRVLESLSDHGKGDVVGNFAVAWLRMDENAALQWCARQQDKPYKGNMFYDILSYYAEEKPSAMLAAIEKLSAVFDENQHYDFMYKLVQKDPLVALGVLQKIPADMMGRHGDGVIGELFKTDADQAVAMARVIWPEGKRGMDIIYFNYERWARSDRKAAEAWLETEADGMVREQIKTKQLSRSDPMAFLGTVDANTNNSPFMEYCISEAMQIAYNSGQGSETLRWLLNNPDQIAQGRMGVFRYGAWQDMKSMLTPADISAVPEVKAREALIDFVADVSTRSQDWQSAVSLLPLVEDSGRQDVLRFKIFSGMMSRESEREAAREWLATQPLSEEVRASWESLVGLATIDE